MEGKAPGSDIVEVILAVDLNPSNPEEPINVNQVKVSPKGGENEGETKLIDELLEVVSKLDPSYAMAIGEAGKDNPRASVRALQKLAEGEKGEDQNEADAFDRARNRPKEPRDTGEPRPGKPRPPREDDEGDEFEPRKKSAGFEGAFGRASGPKPGEPEDQDDDDKKRWR